MTRKILALVSFMASFAANAQVTQKDLQGKWQLVTYADGSATINVLKGTFELDAAYKSGLSASELKEEEHNYSILAKQYAKSWLLFKDGTITGNLLAATLGEETPQAPYSLEDDGTSLVVTMPDGQAFTFAISLEGKKLYIENDEDGIELVYQKQ